MTPEGREKFAQLLYRRELKEPLLNCIELHTAEMAAVFPSGHLRDLTVPVYLLHAASDNVIPPSETAWLSYEIPREKLRAGLISPAIIHADVGDGASFLQKWQLINFLAKVIKLTIWVTQPDWLSPCRNQVDLKPRNIGCDNVFTHGERWKC